LQDSKTLLNLIQPGAMDWGKMKMKARMMLLPILNKLAVMGWHIVENQMNGGFGFGNALFKAFQEVNKFNLPFSILFFPKTHPVLVSNAANSCKAPFRMYSCSTKLGSLPGRAGFVS
jgi:hypothetical protein